MTTPNLTFRILRFTSETCPVCTSQKKLGIVERFVEGLDKPGSTKIIELVCQDKEGNAPAGTPYRRAYELSDVYGIMRFPVLVMELKLDGGAALELFRAEGGVTLPQLKKLHGGSMKDLSGDVKRDLEWST